MGDTSVRRRLGLAKEVMEEESSEVATRPVKLSICHAPHLIHIISCNQLEPPSVKQNRALLSLVRAKWATPTQLFLSRDQIIPVPFNVHEGPAPLCWRRATLGGTDSVIWKNLKMDRRSCWMGDPDKPHFGKPPARGYLLHVVDIWTPNLTVVPWR